MSGYHSPQLEVAIRLNTNEAPESPPQEFRDRLATALADLEWHRYPDRSAFALRTKIAQLESGEQTRFDASNVFVANGSNEVLQTVLLAYGGAGRSAMTFEPTYALHAHISRVTGTGVIEVERNENFELEMGAAVAAIANERPSVVMVCSPNNPTGMVEDPDNIETLLRECEAVGALLVVDEAYGQFAPRSALEQLSPDRPLVVTRTFSKTWSMAAARLGYVIGPSWFVEDLERVALPYHLDAAKQLAGEIALDYVEEMRARVSALVEERGSVEASLRRMPVDVWPSAANFILFRPQNLPGEDVWQALVDRSILVRNCASWPHLRDCLRVTLGTPAENAAFVAALADILGGTQ
jgi:histidinol-phosphate aminotransferase